MVDIGLIAASSAFSGFKNYTSATATGTISSQLIGSGGFATTTISIPLNNANAVSTAQAQFATLDAFYRELSGSVISSDLVTGYSIQAQSGYTGGNLVVSVLAANQSGGSITLPTQTINVQVKLYKAPF